MSMPTNGSAETKDAVDDDVAAVDTLKPNIARVYDYWLGGKDNFAADREEGERILAVYPKMLGLARENRLFLARAVTWVAEQGVRQFLDIGSGLPTAQNTHEIAQQVDPACRVVYVDYDPVVVSHARALLSGDLVAATRGDVRDLAGMLADPAVQRLVKPDEPVGVILAMVLHFFDAETAARITEVLTRSMAPGSYLVMSVGSGDEETGGQLAKEYRAGTLYNHPAEQITSFFQGLALVRPGLTDARNWDPNLSIVPPAQQGGRILAGVGRKAGMAS
jgi:hypothetical protein